MILRVVGVLSCAVLASACLIDRSSLAGEPNDAGTPAPPDARSTVDAWAPPGVDASLDAASIAQPDAVVAGADAWAPDAWAPDAFELPDAFVPPDAVIVPICVPETCNARDDDCDGVVDDDACLVMLTDGSRTACTPFARAGRNYLFCRPDGMWDVARSWCRAFAGGAYDLTAFADGGEQDFVRTSVDRSVWIGMSDDMGRIPAARDEDYRWVDGSMPSFTAWLAPDEPATSREAGCVVLRTDGNWDAASCGITDNDEAWVCEAAIAP